MACSPLSRRKFFMHSAHQTIGVSAGLAALKACDLSAFVVAEETARTLRVMLVSGAPLYKSDESLMALEEYLAKGDRVECLRAFAKGETELPGLEKLDGCDVLLLFTRRLKIDGAPLEKIKEYCQRGGAVVGVRTASHGLQNWLEMDKEVFGGDYSGHFSNETTEVTIVEAAKEHPVLEGVAPFVSKGTLYKNPNIAPDATVLLSGSLPGQSFPVAWTRLHNGGRVFYTSLGHQDDFRDPNFLRLLGNALRWAASTRSAS